MNFIRQISHIIKTPSKLIPLLVAFVVLFMLFLNIVLPKTTIGSIDSVNRPPSIPPPTMPPPPEPTFNLPPYFNALTELLDNEDIDSSMIMGKVIANEIKDSVGIVTIKYGYNDYFDREVLPPIYDSIRCINNTILTRIGNLHSTYNTVGHLVASKTSAQPITLYNDKYLSDPQGLLDLYFNPINFNDMRATSVSNDNNSFTVVHNNKYGVYHNNKLTVQPLYESLDPPCDNITIGKKIENNSTIDVAIFITDGYEVTYTIKDNHALMGYGYGCLIFRNNADNTTVFYNIAKDTYATAPFSNNYQLYNGFIITKDSITCQLYDTNGKNILSNLDNILPLSNVGFVLQYNKLYDLVDYNLNPIIQDLDYCYTTQNRIILTKNNSSQLFQIDNFVHAMY